MNTKYQFIELLSLVAVGVCSSFAQNYELKEGQATPETAQKAHDAADLSRAVEAYRFAGGLL